MTATKHIISGDMEAYAHCPDKDAVAYMGPWLQIGFQIKGRNIVTAYPNTTRESPAMLRALADAVEAAWKQYDALVAEAQPETNPDAGIPAGF